jgi:hypothetical protein
MERGGERLKKEVSPALISVVIVCALVLAGVFLFRAATDKPTYPGLGVGPGGSKPLTPDDYTRMQKNQRPANIPGANPYAGSPAASPGGSSDPNAQTK